MISDNMQIRFFQSVLNTIHRENSIALNAIDAISKNIVFSFEETEAVNKAKISIQKNLVLLDALFNAGCDPIRLYKNKKTYKINEFFSKTAEAINNIYSNENRVNVSFSSKLSDSRCFYINAYEFEHMLYALLYFLFCKFNVPQKKQKIKMNITEKNTDGGLFQISISSEGDSPSALVLSMLRESANSVPNNITDADSANVFSAKKTLLSMEGELVFSRTNSINKFVLKIPQKSLSPFGTNTAGEIALYTPDPYYTNLYFGDGLRKISKSPIDISKIPPEVYDVLRTINQNGHSAFVVGGAVRDIIMNKEVCDFDLASTASCNEICEIFGGDERCRVIKTGERFGTVTVLTDNASVEVTTFRRDGEYKNGRSPEEVYFTDDITEDLKRRDFTVNAMALSANDEFFDPFDGQSDIKNKVIKAVGDPSERFGEDALRILRAVRFSSTLGFEIEPKTKVALFKAKELLLGLSAERICTELKKLILGENAFCVLEEYKDIIAVVIPELKACFDFCQNTPHHIHDVYTHSALAVKNAPKDFEIRLALLLHDIEKPNCRTTDENGISHYKGHAEKSAETAKKILKRLKLSNCETKNITMLIKYHSETLDGGKIAVKKLLCILGEKLCKKLLLLKLDDESAKAGFPTQRYYEVQNAVELFDGIIEGKECYSLKTLEINGEDLKDIGFSGAEIKKALNFLLDAVICERAKNEKSELIKLAKNYILQ